MPRTRMVKHDFFLNENLAKLTPWARLLFIGLWTLADREGRLEDRPQRIKAQIFPYDEVDVDTYVKELARHFVNRYSVDGMNCIEIKKFKKHQHIHPDEKTSILPKNPEIPGDPRKSPEIMPSSSNTSTTTSKDIAHPSDERKTALKPKTSTAAFEAFWTAYPRKVGKKAALKAWLKDPPPPAKALEAIQTAMRSEQWSDPKFIPHPATWLNQGRWEDQQETHGTGRKNEAYV